MASATKRFAEHGSGRRLSRTSWITSSISHGSISWHFGNKHGLLQCGDRHHDDDDRGSNRAGHRPRWGDCVRDRLHSPGQRPSAHHSRCRRRGTRIAGATRSMQTCTRTCASGRPPGRLALPCRQECAATRFRVVSRPKERDLGSYSAQPPLHLQSQWPLPMNPSSPLPIQPTQTMHCPFAAMRTGPAYQVKSPDSATSL